MIRGQPREMAEQDEETAKAKQGIKENIGLFIITVLAIRVAPYVIQMF